MAAFGRLSRPPHLDYENLDLLRLWYLEGQAHSLEGGSWLADFLDAVIYEGVVLPGLKAIKGRQPYGAERWRGVSRAIFDFVGSYLHGFQVLPDAESALKVIDLANEIGVTACSCRKMFDGGPHSEVYRCLGLNHAAHVTFKKAEDRNTSQDIRVIGKDEAKDLVLERRQEGCLQSVAWRLDRRVTWLCNCDAWCGCHRTPELEWDMIPSFFVAWPVFRDRCEQCGECLNWCQRTAIGALRITDAGPVVDPLACWGCGLCTEHCPNGVLALRPREVYYDPIERRRKRLVTGMVAV